MPSTVEMYTNHEQYGSISLEVSEAVQLFQLFTELEQGVERHEKKGNLVRVLTHKRLRRELDRLASEISLVAKQVETTLRKVKGPIPQQPRTRKDTALLQVTISEQKEQQMQPVQPQSKQEIQTDSKQTTQLELPCVLDEFEIEHPNVQLDSPELFQVGF